MPQPASAKTRTLLLALLCLCLLASWSHAAVAAELVSPPPSSTLSGTTVTFTWTPGPEAEGYWVYVGTPSQSTAYSHGPQTETWRTVTGLPQDGSTVKVWLYSKVGDGYPADLLRTYTFTAASRTAEAARLTQPEPGTTLAGSTVTFSWTAGTNVDGYWVYVGTPENSSEFFSGQTSERSITLSNLPTDGRAVRVWLYSRADGEFPASLERTYDYSSSETVTPVPAEFETPLAGEQLFGQTATISWTAGSSVEGYWIYVGTPNNSSAYLSGPTDARSVTVSNLPADGTTVRLWLYSKIAGQYGDVRIRDVTSAAKIPPANAPLDKAVERIRHELEAIRSEREHTRWQTPGGPADPVAAWPDAFLASLAALTYTQGRLSAPMYDYREMTGMPLPLGGTRLAVAKVTLEMEAGLCGNAEAVFEELLLRLGYQARKVDAFYPSGSHTLTEVWYAGKWRAFDPHWGVYWRRPGAEPWDALSTVEVTEERIGRECEVANQSRLWLAVTDSWSAPGARRYRDFWAEPTVTIKVGEEVLFTR